MGSVFMAQLAKDRRNPLLMLAVMAMGVLLTLLFAGGSQGPTKVAVFGAGADGAEAAAAWQRLLNAGGAGELEFAIAGEKEARERVKRGQIPAAVMVTEQDYRLIVASESPSVDQIDRHVRKVFTQELRIRALAAADGADADALRETVRQEMANPPVRVQVQTADGKDVIAYPMETQLLFAFTLLVAMFIAGFKVNAVTHDKVAEIWNRLILSPVTKTGMYLGYLLYSFCVTFLQTLVVLLMYRYVLNFDLGNGSGWWSPSWRSSPSR